MREVPAPYCFRSGTEFTQRLSDLANEHTDNHRAEKNPQRADQRQHLLRGVQNHQWLLVRGKQKIAGPLVLSQ